MRNRFRTQKMNKTNRKRENVVTVVGIGINFKMLSFFLFVIYCASKSERSVRKIKNKNISIFSVAADIMLRVNTRIIYYINIHTRKREAFLL